MGTTGTLWVFLANGAATLLMTGVIWFVQWVHYPLFDRVTPEQFSAFEAAHANRTTAVVMPLMLTEALSALWLVQFRPAGIPVLWAWVGLGLVALIWVSTFLVQVPCHSILGQGFDVSVHQRLVDTNWLRTLAWSLRTLLWLYAAWLLLRHG